MALIHAGMRSAYTAQEAFIYDRIVAPAVAEMTDRVEAELLGLVPVGARVLDVGCGGGQIDLTILRARPDVNVVGVDLSHEQVARGTARARDAGFDGRVRFVQGSALELPFGDGEFDLVLSVASIKHWPDPARGLRECVRVLRAGGRLAVFEADRGCRHADVAEFVARWRMPAALRPVGAMLFRTFVAGESYDLEDAREFAGALPIDDASVRRIAGTPGWFLRGTKRGP